MAAEHLGPLRARYRDGPAAAQIFGRAPSDMAPDALTHIEGDIRATRGLPPQA